MTTFWLSALADFSRDAAVFIPAATFVAPSRIIGRLFTAFFSCVFPASFASFHPAKVDASVPKVTTETLWPPFGSILSMKFVTASFIAACLVTVPKLYAIDPDWSRTSTMSTGLLLTLVTVLLPVCAFSVISTLPSLFCTACLSSTAPLSASADPSANAMDGMKQRSMATIMNSAKTFFFMFSPP